MYFCIFIQLYFFSALYCSEIFIIVCHLQQDALPSALAAPFFFCRPMMELKSWSTSILPFIQIFSQCQSFFCASCSLDIQLKYVELFHSQNLSIIKQYYMGESKTRISRDAATLQHVVHNWFSLHALDEL